MEPHSSQKTQQPNNDQLQPDTMSFDEYYNQLHKDTRLGAEMIHLQGFWTWCGRLRAVLSAQAHFEAQPTDIFIAGMPKTGNTWLKSLVFSTLYRHHHPISDSPVLHHNPHDLVPPLEILVYDNNPTPDLDKFLIHQGQPRLTSTHLPYHALPQSIVDSGCRIVYICRNPLDTFVSSWFFFKRVVETMGNDKFPTMEEYFELYIQGLTSFGPFFEHVLGYWNKSLEMPHKDIQTGKILGYGTECDGLYLVNEVAQQGKVMLAHGQLIDKYGYGINDLDTPPPEMIPAVEAKTCYSIS